MNDMTGSDADAHARLAALEAGTTGAEALAFFDSLPPVSVEAMIGAWRGRDLHTGHPFDGLLPRFGWHGKRFESAEAVHPLVFERPDGTLYSVTPASAPFAALRDFPKIASRPRVPKIVRTVAPLTATTKPKARLRRIEHRGVLTAAMIYDALPIIDIFRRIDDDTVLGLMDMRGDKGAYMFVLTRE
ncbi:DUF4334 domain-containing protein [Acuticoccus sp. M5D2P5]|uniref:DUF4334 domain-containing protein n=1 Tax=Acuticoccus kalidii TaxID=2910977 RepID=UPI001F491541|nr:DUF4334 domain-containing protein [Acuticoccus kalidii]MCF3936726.1 DUF4334 domain-containing protein [Acuticoccus kalidii]